MSEDETIISVVAPCYNDEGNVAELVRRLNAVANEMQVSIEIIVVDDRSPDNAWEVINQLSGEYENFRGYRLSRNFGQHIAITAGIQQSKGAYIVIMDGDLQDRPEEIPNLYSKIQEGYDLVFTVRKDRKDAPSRRLSSRIYRSVINKLSGLDTPTNIAMMRMFTREFGQAYLGFSEKQRSLGALFSWMGYRQTSIEVEHAERFSGRSNFNTWKLMRRAFNNITSFSTIPIAWIGWMGFFIAVISFLFGLSILARYALGNPANQSGWASLLVTVTFSTGMIMLSLSIIGKYIANIYRESLDRPLYFIAERTRDDES